MKSYYFFNSPRRTFVCLFMLCFFWSEIKEREFSMQWYERIEYPKLLSRTDLSNSTNGDPTINNLHEWTSSNGKEYWYKNFWARLTLVIFLIILIQLGVKFRLKLIRYKSSFLTKKIQEHTIQLNNTIEELRRTKEKLYLQNESQKLLLASISHDIKNPLSFIAYISKQSYEDHSLPPDLEDNFKSIYVSSTQLIDFVTSLLNYTKKYNENYLEAPRKKINLQELISTKVSLFKNIAKVQKTSIHCEISCDTEVVLNKELLSIIVHNLIDNAIKNTHSGKITISCYKQDNAINISISDTGVGMSYEVLMYYRNYKYNINNPDVQNKHSGLGFKIISELLVIMNGEYQIESSLGKGTKVTIIFRKNQ